MTEQPANTTERLICHACGQRYWVAPNDQRACLECGGPLRHFGPIEGLVDRFFAPGDQVDSILYRRHLQIVEELWTQDNRGREYYEILKPKMSYGRFQKAVTQLVCRGLYQGWAELVIPRAPIPDDQAYRLVFNDPDRFIDEMTRLFERR